MPVCIFPLSASQHREEVMEVQIIVSVCTVVFFFFSNEGDLGCIRTRCFIININS